MNQHHEKSTALKYYFKELDNIQITPKAQHNMLVAQAQTGDTKARATIIINYLQFVVSVANKYKTLAPFEDLISEGNIGLMRAIEKYNIKRTDIKFYSYAVYWVKAYIFQYIYTYSSMIRIPVGKSRKIDQLHKISEQLFQKLNRDPTNEEIEGSGDIYSAESVKDGIFYKTSIDQPISSHEDFKLEDMLEDDTAERIIIEFADRDMVAKLMTHLNGEEQYVLKESYGIDTIPKPIKEIAKEMKRTCSQVNTIKYKALAALKKIILKTNI